MIEERKPFNLGAGFVYLIVGEVPDYSKPDSYLVAAYRIKKDAEEHLRLVRDFARKLDLVRRIEGGVRQIWNPYDPMWNNTLSSPNYFLVTLPFATTSTLESMHRNAEHYPLIIECVQCGKTGGDKFPEGSQRFIRVFNTFDIHRGGWICSECEWLDELERKTTTRK